MKKVLLLCVFTFSGFSYAKEVPGPQIWYNISEKILIHSYHLLAADKDSGHWRNVNQQRVNTKTLDVSSKYGPKKQIVLPDYISVPANYIATDQKSIWILAK